MRKFLLSFIFYCCALSVVYAAPSYGPYMPKQKEFFGGFQTYAVFNRTLEEDFGRVRSLQDFLLISYGVFDWLSIDLKGGAGNVRQREGAGPRADYRTFLAGGYGFRLKLYDHDNTKVVCGFQHISVHPFTVSADGAKHKVVLDDWQFPFLVSHEFQYLRPYAGVRWSWMNEIHWTNGNRKLEKSPGTGLIIGTDIPINKKVWFNVEGQFFDATAVAASINFSF